MSAVVSAAMGKWIRTGLLALALAGGSSGGTAGGSAGNGSAKRGTPSLQLQPCRLQHPDGVQSVAARCGWLEVAENPAAPHGARIKLRIAVVPALDQDGPADPLFVVAGGPGQGAGEFYASAAGAFSRVQRSRDLVLVDQRGTGGSNPLGCPFPDEEEVADMSAVQVQALTRKCLESLKGDPRYYTTSIAVHDLDAVRAALGYKQINLYGVSYGTRVVQHYLRRHPAHVRAVILDGVVPPQQVLAVDSAVQAQRALDMIFARCMTDDNCHAAFPDPAGDFAKLRSELARAPAQVTFPDPVTGEVTTSPVRLIDIQMAVRLLSYNSPNAALLPLLLHEGAARNNLGPLAAQSRMIAEQLSDALSIGMHNSVVCTEDAPFFTAAAPDRQALGKSYLGTMQLDMLEQMCSVWPRGTIDADFHAPLDSQTPALVLSGSADPVTPPSYAEQALKGLHNSLHVVLEGQGHGQLGTGCIPNLLAKFLDRGSVKGLDTSCAHQAAPAPFFISFSGPAP